MTILCISAVAFTYWWSVGSKVIYYIGIICPHSLPNTSKSIELIGQSLLGDACGGFESHSAMVFQFQHILYRGYIGIMEKKMETAMVGLYRV